MFIATWDIYGTLGIKKQGKRTTISDNRGNRLDKG